MSINFPIYLFSVPRLPPLCSSGDDDDDAAWRSLELASPWKHWVCDMYSPFCCPSVCVCVFVWALVEVNTSVPHTHMYKAVSTVAPKHSTLETPAKKKTCLHLQTELYLLLHDMDFWAALQQIVSPRVIEEDQGKCKVCSLSTLLKKTTPKDTLKTLLCKLSTVVAVCS